VQIGASPANAIRASRTNTLHRQAECKTATPSDIHAAESCSSGDVHVRPSLKTGVSWNRESGKANAVSADPKPLTVPHHATSRDGRKTVSRQRTSGTISERTVTNVSDYFTSAEILLGPFCRHRSHRTEQSATERSLSLPGASWSQ
jgi:hypothetical protein